jgi:hypothetical protein
MPSTAAAGPYVDQSLTLQGPYSQSSGTPTPAPSGPTTLGEITVYNVAGRLTTLASIAAANTTAVSPPKSPNYWATGRDLYANGGAVGQTFFNNQA